MLNNLQLITGIDIPFISGGVTIHQPRMSDIAAIGGETVFRFGNEVLFISKNKLSIKDKSDLEEFDNFDILMSIISQDFGQSSDNFLLLLSILFPYYQIEIDDIGIKLIKSDNDFGYIDKKNFEEFKDIVKQIFCLEKNEESDFDPANESAKKIAEKIRKGRAKVQLLKNAAMGEKDDILTSSMFEQYMSILSIGLGVDINIFNNYTIYQLNDAFDRFLLKDAGDIHLKASLAGATGMDPVDNWMGDSHRKKNKK